MCGRPEVYLAEDKATELFAECQYLPAYFHVGTRTLFNWLRTNYLTHRRHGMNELLGTTLHHGTFETWPQNGIEPPRRPAVAHEPPRRPAVAHEPPLP